MRSAASISIGILCWLGMATAAGQDVTAEQQKLMAKRAAEADAYRKLAEIVYGLQINSRTYVQDFVAESDEIRGDVDTFIKGVRLGTPMWYEDGSCEVPAEVTTAKVIETLRSAHSQHYHGDHIKTNDFDSMAQHIEKKIIKVVGRGAPRPDLPPDLPQGVTELLGPPPTAGPPPVPAIWQKIGPQARLSALQAARVDAQRRLVERIKGLRLTARTQVRDFVAESDTINTEVNASLVGAEERGSYLHNNELIAEVTLAVSTEQVIETIKTLHSRHYKGDDIHGSDIENIVRTVVKREFEATGMGIPNPRFIRKDAEAAGPPMPDWSLRGLEAEGQGTDPEMGTPQGKLRAARAAEMDARRKLAEQIGGLRLEANTTVRNFTDQHEEVAGLLDAVIVDAVVTNTRFTENTAVVTIAIPGARVWSAISDDIRRPPH